MSDMINVNKSRTIVWAGHIARMGNNRKYIKFWLQNHKEIYYLENLRSFINRVDNGSSRLL
jgi:hypothetical protein